MKYRKMQRCDHKEILNLITEAWFSEYTFKKYIIDLYAKGYIHMYLLKSDYRIVCTNDDNKVVGFIFGKCKSNNIFIKLYHYICLFLIGVVLLFSKAGRRGIHINNVTERVNHKLLKLSGKFDSCLELFIVTSVTRGKGVGSKLLNDFMDYLKENNHKSIYLYTDTYSDYGFYEKRGFERKAELPVKFNVDAEDEYSVYYLYAKEL